MNTQIRYYEQQAIDFMNKHELTFTASYTGHSRHFHGEKETRDIWECIISRKGDKGDIIKVTFGQSIANSDRGKTKPSAYDILACLTKSDPGEFEDFCNEFGYNDNKYAYPIWESVVEEWNQVDNFFTSDELTDLQEIA